MNGVFQKSLCAVGVKPDSILSFGQLETRPRRQSASLHPPSPPRLAVRRCSFGWSWITEIDYAVTPQIPLPRAWPRLCVTIGGQACLGDLPPAAPGAGPGSRTGPCGVTRPSTVANARRSLTSAGQNKDVSRFKYHSGAFSRLTQSPRRHLPSLGVQCHPS